MAKKKSKRILQKICGKEKKEKEIKTKSRQKRENQNKRSTCVAVGCDGFML